MKIDDEAIRKALAASGGDAVAQAMAGAQQALAIQGAQQLSLRLHELHAVTVRELVRTAAMFMHPPHDMTMRAAVELAAELYLQADEAAREISAVLSDRNAAPSETPRPRGADE